MLASLSAKPLVLKVAKGWSVDNPDESKWRSHDGAAAKRTPCPDLQVNGNESRTFADDEPPRLSPFVDDFHAAAFQPDEFRRQFDIAAHFSYGTNFGDLGDQQTVRVIGVQRAML